MKTKLLLVMVLIACFVNAQSNFSINTINKNTRGITKINFFKDAKGDFKVRIYAKCSPKDCDWGAFKIQKDISFEEYLRRKKGPYVPLYNVITIKKSFVTRTITINTRKDKPYQRYRVDVFSNYKDPKRKDKTEHYLMKR
ncbi:MAG: hypothetical protein AB8B59_17045 [Maribacter sp.]